MYDGIRKALTESHRIRSLRIDVGMSEFDCDETDWLLHKTLSLLQSIQMPRLEFVHVDLQWYELPGRYSSFLGHHTPENLRHLSLLRGIDIAILPCAHLLAPSLTHLKLECETVWETMEDALHTLSLLHNLEVLSIDRDKHLDDDPDQPSALPDVDMSELMDDVQPVHLPKLRELVLREPLAQIAYLLKNLVFPPTARIDLHAMKNSVAAEGTVRSSIAVATSALKAHYAPLVEEGRYFDSLLLDLSVWYRRRRLLVAADHIAVPSSTITGQHSIRLIPIGLNKHRHICVQIYKLPFSFCLCDDNSFSERGLIESFVDLPVFRSARALTFTEEVYSNHTYERTAPDPFDDSDPVQWNTMMSPLKQVSVAHFYGHTGVHAILGLLREDEGVTYSHLVDLTIEEVSFVAPSELASERKPACVSFDTLVSVLNRRTGQDRMQSVANLRRLKLKSCDIDRAQIDVLRCDLGEDFVSWDGRQRGTDESSSHARHERMWSMSAESLGSSSEEM
ncbi:unnamed protein product [Peniophora sp. CBMAI 1063]|nr:unnamed protein product [Peniophora sp. CBMAI 1063]